MPAVSPTVCVPVETSTAPVVPPHAALAPVPKLEPSTCRLNRSDVAGTQTLFTVSVGFGGGGTLRVLVIVHTLLSPAARVTEPLAAQAPPIADV